MSIKFVSEDMLLRTDLPVCAGSRMLESFQSLFASEALNRLTAAGYTLGGKVRVGEFAIDLLGETSYFGAELENGTLRYPAAVAIRRAEADAAIVFDVNGAPRRGAAQSDLCVLKPTYGTVSRFGTIPVACSGECVGVMARTPALCGELYAAMAGHDDKDGTSLPDSMVAEGKAVLSRKNKVVIPLSLQKGVEDEVAAKLNAAADALRAKGVEVVTVDGDLLAYAGAAWNILMSAELCNNVSHYDGVKYGYRSQSYSNIDELYTNSRTEAFGELLKYAILFGSETLSTENYQKVYDKALRVRRVVGDAMKALLADADALLMPALSTMAYTQEAVEADKTLSYRENFYTAPASITGLPALVCGGVQLVGNAFSEDILLSLAEQL